MTKSKDFFKVRTSENADSADIYLYGYIGQSDWWNDDEDKNDSLTDIIIARKMRELEQKYKRINIRINSPGGSMLHGDAIISAIRQSTSEVHTYVDGLAASMAADIWLSGNKRHIATNGKLMIHNCMTVAFGNAKVMRQAADMLDKFDSSAISLMVELTSMSEEECRTKFYDYEDHWLTKSDLVELGLVDENDDAYTTTNVPDPSKMNMMQLVKYFNSLPEEEEEAQQSFIQKIVQGIQAAFKTAKPVEESIDFITNNDYDMNIQEFEKSLKDSSLPVEDVIKSLHNMGYSVKTQADIDAEDKLAQDMHKTLADLRSEVVRLAEKAADIETRIAGSADPGDGVSNQDALDSILKEQAEMASKYHNPFVGV